jgi:alpha/beta superfamily hydrolase
MKKYIYILLLICIASTQSFAQCGDRYVDTVFSAVTKTPNIIYGNNTTIAGANKNLFVDIYQPTGDTFEIRPLIILAHGGSFISGSRTSADIVQLCNNFAKRGYVTASISYRLYDNTLFPLPDSLDMYDEAIKAVTDYKAAIRYFYKDRATSNTYKIDTNQIFIGGVSAGAITAINTAYIDSPNETAPWIQTIIANNGGLEGTSGNAGYSSKVKALISVCGAVGNTDWIDANDEPIVSLHGTADDVVPYGYGCATIATICIAYLEGSGNVHARCNALGIDNFLRIHYGQGHVPFAAGGAVGQLYMDTTINDIANFIAPITVCSPTVGIFENNDLQFVAYPNPVSSVLNIEAENLKLATLTDVFGKKITSSNNSIMDINNVSNGVYMLHITNAKGQNGVRKIVIQK